MLADGGFIERRKDERISTRYPADVLKQGKDQSLAATIIDYSEGGLCLETPEAQHIGEKIRIVINSNLGKQGAMLRVRWTIRRSEDVQLAGCEFLSMRDSAGFLNALGNNTAGNE